MRLGLIPRAPVIEQPPASEAPLPARVEAGRPTPAALVSLPLQLPIERRRAAGRRMSLPLLSFAGLVLLPVALAAVYLFAVAADQYVAEFRFSLAGSDPPRIDALALLAGNAGHSPAASQSQIVVQYIASRAIVDQLDPLLDLRQLFSPPQADWWARLELPASIEQLVHHWQGQVDPFYDPANGTVVVRVRAFTAAEALRLAQAIVTVSEKLVNDLSVRARRDALAHAEAEVAQAEARLKTILDQIRAFRDREGMIDPGRAAEATGTLAAKLRDELVRANAELATLLAYMHEDAPAVKVLRARIRALEAQRQTLAHDLTDPERSRTDVLSRLLGSYEQLDSERRFAESAYQHALHRLDQARADADRQQVYIASFVPPGLPEQPLYPRRWRSLGVVALLAFAVWGIGGLTAQSIRDHL
jgi:capsular polysaccharide transport system permease protein